MAQFVVTGLSELRRALRMAELEDPRLIKAMLKDVSDAVIDKARPRLESQLHDPRSTGGLAASMKPASTLKSASVVLGTPVRRAYAGWWEFGGPRARSHRPPNRPFVKSGRSLYPSLADARPAIQAKTELIVQRLADIITAM